MFRAIQMLFTPMPAWQAVVAANRGMAWGLFATLLPVMLIGLAVEGAGLAQLGERKGEYAPVARIDPELLSRYLLVSLLAGISTVLLSAIIIDRTREAFDFKAPFGRVFALFACAMAPIYLLKIPDAIPAIPTWVCFAVGALLSISVLYHGVGLGLQPEQTKGFGIFLISTMTFIVIAGVARFLEVATLHEKVFQNLKVPALF